MDLDKIVIRPKHKRKKEEYSLEKSNAKRAQTLRYKIQRGDLDYKNNKDDNRLYYWGIKRGIIDKDLNIL